MSSPPWSEQDSQAFIDFGRYFVPERERQVATVAGLIPPREGPFTALDLACGEGLLAEAILERFPQATVLGLDLSPAMLARASERLAAYGERFQTRQFDLAAGDWRGPEGAAHAIVSSLSVHHLDGPQKRALFADLWRMLAPGGALVIADVVLPATLEARALAAATWEEEVARRALALDGSTAALDYFRREGWNMYRAEVPDDYDKPSTLAEQLAWLAEAGFVGVDVAWMLAGHAIFGGRKAGA
jgi:tRNA (cmo5U34)-methyltransferase